MPAVIYHVFRELNVGGFTINFNNRKLLAGLFENFSLEDGERRKLALREIDKMDKIGRDKVIDSLTGGDIALDRDLAVRLLDAIGLTGSNAEIVAALEAMPGDSELFRQGLSELKAVLEGLRALQVPEEFVKINPAIARGLDYYTGTVYETFLNDFPGVGSVCSGGRYDNLASHYTKSKLPGVGISIGATRLFYQLKEAGVIKADRSTSAVLVTQLDPGALHRLPRHRRRPPRRRDQHRGPVRSIEDRQATEIRRPRRHPLRRPDGHRRTGTRHGHAEGPDQGRTARRTQGGTGGAGARVAGKLKRSHGGGKAGSDRLSRS